jgi:hypothetical protein
MPLCIHCYRGLSAVHGDQAKLKGYDARIAVHWVSNQTGRCLEPTVTDYLAEPGERPRDADARTLIGADHAVGSFLIDKLRTGERGGTLHAHLLEEAWVVTTAVSPCRSAMIR